MLIERWMNLSISDEIITLALIIEAISFIMEILILSSKCLKVMSIVEWPMTILWIEIPKSVEINEFKGTDFAAIVIEGIVVAAVTIRFIIFILQIFSCFF